jgi:hypothetical protein
MIELVPGDNDDVAFLSLVQRIMNGVIAALQVYEVYLVHIDNWFDHKWLGWRSRRGRRCVPMFTPNRVLSQKHFMFDRKESAWKTRNDRRKLHLLQPGRPYIAQPIDQFSKSAAFVWYSGNTTKNTLGSLMVYASGPEGSAWYASFRKDKHWAIADGYAITPNQLISFEKRGLEMELVKA